MKFFKMHGCGNDFLLVDAMSASGSAPRFTSAQVKYLCHRQFGIGADGIIVLQPGKHSEARWDFFNSDGSGAEMCGNGARCAIRFLSERYFPRQEEIRLETVAGVIRGSRLSDGRIQVALFSKGEKDFKYTEKVLDSEGTPIEAFCIDTGVPHAVIEVKDIKTYPISRIGRAVGLHGAFRPSWTNVTFFQRTVGRSILSTTFERGVWQETFACGTGATAAAIIFSERYLQPFPIEVTVPGGTLTVDLSPATKTVLLQGPAEHVMEIELDEIPREFADPRLYGERRAHEA